MRPASADRTLEEALAGYRPPHRSRPETVDLGAAAGRTAAGDVVSPILLPAFNRSAVDGWAIAAGDAPGRLRRAGAVRMGEPPASVAGGGSAVAVPTGGRLPEGADAVVMSELAGATAETVEIRQPVRPGENVVTAGEDVKPGQPVIHGGTRLRAPQVALLASLGVSHITVYGRPRVAIVSTGDELVGHGEAPDEAQVRDANGPALAAVARRLGADPVHFGIVADEPDELLAVCRRAVDACDVVVVSAGGSVGERDTTAAVLERLGRPGVWCHGLALKPGRPTTLAEAAGKPVIGLPGNPVPALLVMQLVCAPVIGRVGGLALDDPPARRAGELAEDVPGAPGVLRLVHARLEERLVRPVFARPSRLSAMAAADGLLRVPGSGLRAGQRVEIELYA
ncbi:MAG TPA: molybdopterin molybdotransferase MoeA [Gaiellales bacterium]|nr:molybdopterin molybdotransferase MoeA [Gaiellales bacterium]